MNRENWNLWLDEGLSQDGAKGPTCQGSLVLSLPVRSDALWVAGSRQIYDILSSATSNFPEPGHTSSLTSVLKTLWVLQEESGKHRLAPSHPRHRK